MKRCMYCGQENEDAASSCVKCGNPLLDMPAEEANTIEDIDLSDDSDMKIAEDRSADRRGVKAAEEVAFFGDEAEAEEPVEQEAAAEEYVPAEETTAQEQLPTEEVSFEEEPAAAEENNTYIPEEYGYEEEAEDEEDMDEYPAGHPQIERKSRKMVKSFLFFLAALVFTISVGAEIANIASGAAVENLRTVTAFMKNLIGDNMIISMMNGTVIPTVLKYQQQNALIIPAVGIALAIPQILIALGLWMAFSSISVKKQYVSTAGLTMVRVIEILKFIVACFALLAVIGLTVSFVVAAAAAGSNGSMMTLIIGIITLLVVVIAAVFVIMYFVQLIFALRAIRTNVRNGESVGRVPGFVIFIGLICCLVVIASMIPMAPDDYIGLAARGSKALWLLLITLWAFAYRLVVKVKQN